MRAHKLVMLLLALDIAYCLWQIYKIRQMDRILARIAIIRAARKGAQDS